MQEHWIGRSEGVNLSFPYELEGTPKLLRVYTTRPDTLMGVSFVAIAAEHPLAAYVSRNRPDLQAFIEECSKGSVSEADMASMERRACPPASTSATRSRATTSRSGSPTTFS